MSDYYNILGIKIDSTKDEIKKAYNNLVKIYYPDKPTGNAVLFEKITAAYKTLMSESERSLYDEQLQVKEFANLKRSFRKDVKIINVADLGSLPQPEKDSAILESEMAEMIADKKLITQDDDIETTPPLLFSKLDGFDRVAFNSMFDKLNPKSQTIIPYDEIISGYDTLYNNYNDEDTFDNEHYSDNFLLDISNQLESVSFNEDSCLDINDDTYKVDSPLTEDILVKRMREYNSFII